MEPIGDGAAAGVTYRFLVEPSWDRQPFHITSAEAKPITEARRAELVSESMLSLLVLARLY